MNTEEIHDKSEDSIRKEFLSRISAWDYEWLTKDQENVPYKNITGEQTPLLRIGNSFESYEHYFKTMFPLLLLETMGTVIKSWKDKRMAYSEQNMPKPPICFVKKNPLEDDPRDVHLVFQSNFSSFSRTFFVFSINSNYF